MKSVGYYWGQIVQFPPLLIGLAILWLPCLLKAWEPCGVSNKLWPAPYLNLNGRSIDGWKWKWLHPWYHNPEDGDSGMTALVWQNGELVVYNPTGSRWKAYVWSAWRNSVDGLKYKYPQE